MKKGILSARSLGVVIALQASFAAGSAHAQSASAQSQAAAEGLFSDAKKLMADGNYADACPKLEESQRLDPAPGTQFKLGECYEQVGRTASAWALFLDVAAVAKSAGMADREKIARDRAIALEGKLPKLVITVPAPALGMEVKRDGVLVGAAQYGSSVAVDPGKHAIVATAPGKETWTSTTEVAPEAKVTVTVPALADAPVAAVPAAVVSPGPDLEQKGLGTQKTLAIVAGGVGVVGLAVGTIFGFKAMSTLDDSNQHCTGNTCDATGVSLRSDTLAAGNISTIGFAVAIVGLVGGAVLWFTAPSSSSSSAQRAGAARWLGGTF